MRKIGITIIVCSLAMVSCKEAEVVDQKENPISAEEITEITELENEEGPFDILFQMEKVADDFYNLIIPVDVDEGSYFLSPYSNDIFFGKFSLNLENEDHLVKVDSILEYPATVEEQDPFGNGVMMVARVKTTYTQKVNLVHNDDFELKGFVAFTAEPVCNRFVTNFNISYKNGEMKIYKVNTVIDNLVFED